MNINELLETDVNTLKERQHDALQSGVVEFLRDIAFMIEEGQYDEVLCLTLDSNAGDGYGSDNTVLDFGSVWESGERDGTDIGVVIEKLKELCE